MLRRTSNTIGARSPKANPLPGQDPLKWILDDAHLSSRTTDAALDAYRDAGINGLRSALAILAVLALGAQFYVQRIPSIQPGAGLAGPAETPV